MEEKRGDHVFVVRMWAESRDRHVMRGRIDHPASGERRYFSNFGDICDFMTAAPTFARRTPDDPALDDGDSRGEDLGDP